MSVTCLILAGGLGLRLRKAVPDRPKCLAPIGDRSFLEIQLELFANQGITDFVLSLGYQSEQVQAEANRLARRFKIECVVEPIPLGTGGAIGFAMDNTGLSEALVANGDTFLSGNLDAMLPALDLARGELTRMATVKVEDRSRYGGVEVRGDRVVGFSEKGCAGPGTINAGVYRVSSEVFAPSENGRVFSFETTILQNLSQNGNLFASSINGDFIDIGIPQEYFRFCSKYG